TSDQFGDGHAFLEALVREHRAAHAIADRPHAFHTGPAVIVDFDATALVDFDSGAFAEHALRERAAADSDEQLVDGDFLFALGVGVSHFDCVAFDFGLADFRAELDVESLLG